MSHHPEEAPGERPIQHAPAGVLFPFLGSEIGGSHVSAMTLAEVLTHELGVTTTFLLAGDNAIAAEVRRRGLDAQFTGEPATARHMPWTDASRLRPRSRILARHGRDWVVHCNDIASLQSWGALARVRGHSVIYHNRALNRMVPPNSTLVRAANRVLCISQACREAVAFLPERRVETILNPITVPDEVDREAARIKLAGELSFDPDRRFIGFVGNFWKRKRPIFALEAFQALSIDFPQHVLVLFGRAGDHTQEELEAEVERLGLSGRVAFAGFRLPLEQNIAAVDLLLLPAVLEPFGRTLIEAGLLRTPYVATDQAGHHEIGSRWGGGVLAPAGASPAEFGTLAAACLRAPERAILEGSAYERVVRDFSPQAHAAAVMRSYRTARET